MGNSFMNLHKVLPLVFLSIVLGATSPAVAIDRLCLLAGIDLRPPIKAVRDQELQRLTAEVEKVKDELATDQDHLDYWWGEANEQRCFPIGKSGQSADCKRILESIAFFAKSVRQLESDFETKKAALADLLTRTSKVLKDEADNADNIAKCTAAAQAAPSAAAVPGEDQPAGSFSVELTINGQGCTATPGHDCLKEFVLNRGKDGPTPPLTIVAKMSGFPTDNYTLTVAGRPPPGGRTPKECTGNTTCSWTLPGFKATDPIPVEDDFAASLKWLGKKDRQRDKGGAGNLVDGVVARVYVHYPAP
jgi:hypothetical protein